MTRPAPPRHRPGRLLVRPCCAMRRSPTTAEAATPPAWRWTPPAWTTPRVWRSRSGSATPRQPSPNRRAVPDPVLQPRAEVAFCGHATIATAVAVAERDGPVLLRFDTLACLVAVRTSPTPAGLTATLTSVPTRTRPAQAAELDAALTALRWRGEDLDPRYPARDPFRSRWRGRRPRHRGGGRRPLEAPKCAPVLA